MIIKHQFVVAAALLVALVGCGDDDDAPVDAGGGLDASLADGGLDAGSVDAAVPDASVSDAGTSDAALADAGALDAGSDGGPDPFDSDAGATIEIVDGGGSAGDAGSGDAGTVSPTVVATITRQQTPTDLDEPALLVISTQSFHPIELRNARVNPPGGWRIASVDEDLAARVCPTGSGGSRCRQSFVLTLYPDGACRFDGSDFVWTWDAGCAPGGDCDRIPASLTTYSIIARPMSADFCAGLPARTSDPFFPSAGMLRPTSGEDPVTLRFYTTLDLPYRLAAGTVVPPAGFTLVGFTEDTALRECDTATFPDACRQWWDVVVDPGTACSARGAYAVTWSVSCETGGDCDPAITEYTIDAAVVEDRDLCP